jgi:hypothetical protein
VTGLNPAPVNIGIEETIFTVDPVSGDYLVFNNARQFYAFNVQTGAWKQQNTVPPVFTSGYGIPVHGAVASPVSTHGVVMFVTCEGSDSCRVIVYKHAVPAAVESGRLGGRNAPSVIIEPNPIASSAMLHFAGFGQGPMPLRIYNVKGEQVADLSDRMESGTSVRWETGSLATGIYLLQAKISGHCFTRKVLVQK